MKVVLPRASGALADQIVPRLLAEGHDVRVPPRPGGGAERRRLPVGVRAVDGGSPDVVLVLGPDLAALAEAAARGERVIVVTDRQVDAVEELLAGCGAPWTLQVTTVLHDDLAAALDAAPAVPHGATVQPIDAAEVADRVVRLLRAAPACRVPDAGGPRLERLGDLAPDLPDGPAPDGWPDDWFEPRRAAARVAFGRGSHGSGGPDAGERSGETEGAEVLRDAAGAVAPR